MYAQIIMGAKHTDIFAHGSTNNTSVLLILLQNYISLNHLLNIMPKTLELELTIIDIGKRLLNRKVKEARFIQDKQPSLNGKDELNDLKQFLV